MMKFDLTGAGKEGSNLSEGRIAFTVYLNLEAAALRKDFVAVYGVSHLPQISSELTFFSRWMVSRASGTAIVERIKSMAVAMISSSKVKPFSCCVFLNGWCRRPFRLLMFKVTTGQLFDLRITSAMINPRRVRELLCSMFPITSSRILQFRLLLQEWMGY
jgi:hypothetical protein